MNTLASFRGKSRLQRSGQSPQGQAFKSRCETLGIPAGCFDFAALRPNELTP
jgi:hypothetical protein